MEEQHLLFQVLDDGVPIEDIKTWLDDAFEVNNTTSCCRSCLIVYIRSATDAVGHCA